jgi:hypothetical protein
MSAWRLRCDRVASPWVARAARLFAALAVAALLVALGQDRASCSLLRGAVRREGSRAGPRDLNVWLCSGDSGLRIDAAACLSRQLAWAPGWAARVGSSEPVGRAALRQAWASTRNSTGQLAALVAGAVLLSVRRGILPARAAGVLIAVSFTEFRYEPRTCCLVSPTPAVRSGGFNRPTILPRLSGASQLVRAEVDDQQLRPVARNPHDQRVRSQCNRQYLWIRHTPAHRRPARHHSLCPSRAIFKEQVDVSREPTGSNIPPHRVSTCLGRLRQPSPQTRRMQAMLQDHRSAAAALVLPVKALEQCGGDGVESPAISRTG